jgi:hypothetical protein
LNVLAGENVCSDVDILLFPVKLGPVGQCVLAAIFGVVASACGYRAALASAPSMHLSVVAVPFSTPDVAAVDAVLGGAREELARAEALSSSPYPRLVLEVTRVDELPASIAASGGQPLGRGASVGVTARGWVEERAEGPPLHDTGDVRRVETVEQGTESLGSAVAAADAVRAAARRTGRAVALRVLGRPEPGPEPL